MPKKIPAFLQPLAGVESFDSAAALVLEADAEQSAPPLAFDQQPQQASYWCWAAVAASVCDYYAKPPYNGPASQSQCELATHYTKTKCCGVSHGYKDEWDCNKAFTLVRVLKDLGAFHPPVRGRPNIGALRDEIMENRPVCCGIDIHGSDTDHFVVIIGIDGADRVILRDPEGLHSGPCSYAELREYFDKGRWTQTYFTKPRNA